MMRSFFFFTGAIVAAALLAGCGEKSVSDTSGAASSSGAGGAGGASGGEGGAGGGAPDACAGVVCKALDACHVAGVCDPLTGKCSNPNVADGTQCGVCGACTAGACGARALGLTSVGPGTPQPTSLTSDNENLFITNQFGGATGAGTMERMPKTGGAAIAIHSAMTAPYGITRVGVQLRYVDSSSGLWAATTDGSVPLTLLITKAPNGFRGTASRSTNTWITDFTAGEIIHFNPPLAINQVIASGLAGPHDIVADELNIYWVNALGGTIAQMPRDGGPIITLASNVGAPYGIAVDDTHVYFVDSTLGKVRKVPIGGGVVTNLALGQDFPYVVTVKQDYVYWGNYGSAGVGGVAKAPIKGGPTTVIPGHVGVPVAMAHDDKCLFWVSVSDSQAFSADL